MISEMDASSLPISVAAKVWKTESWGLLFWRIFDAQRRGFYYINQNVNKNTMPENE
jgi:hypothetical protein